MLETNVVRSIILLPVSIFNSNCIMRVFYCKIYIRITRRELEVTILVELPYNPYKPITNTAWVLARLCKLPKGCIRLAAVSDKAYQLLAHGRWFSPGTPYLTRIIYLMQAMTYCLFRYFSNPINRLS
jgi:hypothetical protein